MESTNREAVVSLKALGFPLANIRKALPKLIGITHPEMADKLGTSRSNITNHINGDRDIHPNRLAGTSIAVNAKKALDHEEWHLLPKKNRFRPLFDKLLTID